MTAIPRRLVELKVQLAANSGTNQPNTFAGGTDTAAITGLRCSVRIQNSGAPAGSSAQVLVWGLTPSLTNQLATLGLAWNIVPKNSLFVSAGDEGGTLSPVFAGTILAGYAEYGSSPDVPFHFECQSGLAAATANAPPTSFPGTVDVATAMAGFAKALGYTFENNGVNVKLPSSYLDGNLRTQMQKLADDANINAEVVPPNVLAIWPKGGNRATADVPLIAPPPAGHMIGYPSYTQQGIIVKNVFDPRITMGSLVKVQTSLKPVNDVGTWAVNTIDLALDSLLPKGQWMQTITAWNPKYPKPIPQQAQQ